MTWLVWALLSALFAAATAILAKIGVAGIDSNLATAIRTTVVLATPPAEITSIPPLLTTVARTVPDRTYCLALGAAAEGHAVQ